MPLRSMGVIATSSGRATSPFTTYSRNACMARDASGGRDRSRSLLSLLDETAHRVAGLRALAEPVIRAIEFQIEIVALLERLIGANLLNELAVARAAVVGHDNAIDRGVCRPDSFHANSNCHKLSLCFVRPIQRPPSGF